MNKLRKSGILNSVRQEATGFSWESAGWYSVSEWVHPTVLDWTYELRSCQLQPGTMFQWGNHWACKSLASCALRFRQDGNEAVGGFFFSQTGQLYMVHHLWAYKDLQTREDIWNAAWHKHDWEELVYYTVPLIQKWNPELRILQKTLPLQWSDGMEMRYRSLCDKLLSSINLNCVREKTLKCKLLYIACKRPSFL